MTCPVLVRRIGTLEAAGWMNAVTARLGSDEPFKERLKGAIGRYRERRDSHESIEDSGSPPGGGPDRIKCAHAHVAHELAGGMNPVGRSALAATGHPDCLAPCFEVR